MSFLSIFVVTETIPFPEYLLHSLHFTSSQWGCLTITVSGNKLWEAVPKCRSCQTGVMCGCARQGRTAVLLRTVLCAVGPAVFPLSDFPLLGRSFAEVLKLKEAIQWQAIHMCKYLRVRTGSGLENLNILAPTEETLRISCCWNTHFPQSSLHTPYCWQSRILSVREQPGRINTECLFCLKELAEGERL